MNRIDYHDKEYNSLLQSKRWRLLRKQVLSEHKCLCQRCLENGRISAATTVHHITPVQWGISYHDKVSLAFDKSNLQPLCDDCHKAIHREMGKQTRKANELKTQAYIERFKKKFLE